jgi:TonB system transport protein ExbD (group 1)
MAASPGDQDPDDMAEVSEINVTPFIDVMLVLLIIFMVAAPLSTVDVPVDLPAAAVAPQQRPEKPVFLTVKADLTLVIGEEVVGAATLADVLRGATEGDKARRIFVRADKSVPYGELMKVMDQLRSGGFLKVALVALEARAP